MNRIEDDEENEDENDSKKRSFEDLLNYSALFRFMGKFLGLKMFILKKGKPRFASGLS